VKIFIKVAMFKSKADDFLRVVITRIQASESVGKEEAKFEWVSHVAWICPITDVIYSAFPGSCNL
jgi:hypothetical protein